MTPPPQAFRLVYRAFDQAKSDEVFEARAFDLGYASRIFPGYVLEREVTRGGYGERRFKVGDWGVAGDVLVVIYTPRGRACRLITAWTAELRYWELWHDLTR